MDVVFDIDGTLANAEHRLHHIRDMAHWVGVPPKPNWDEFLKDELVAKDAPVPETWQLLTTMLEQPQDYRVIFITGRRESTREMTYEWLRNQPNCKVRVYAWYAWEQLPEVRRKPLGPIIYMRPDGDRRPSAEVKRDLLKRARLDGFDPKLVFEGRHTDTKMWREEGLVCCQVADGNY